MSDTTHQTITDIWFQFTLVRPILEKNTLNKLNMLNIGCDACYTLANSTLIYYSYPKKNIKGKYKYFEFLLTIVHFCGTSPSEPPVLII